MKKKVIISTQIILKEAQIELKHTRVGMECKNQRVKDIVFLLTQQQQRPFITTHIIIIIKSFNHPLTQVEAQYFLRELRRCYLKSADPLLSWKRTWTIAF